ncbi:MAG TPA: hypothetical protein VJ111_08145 [Chitinophagaceae bacterium]|nr:hypothetical protein [Chitinophagaceae bacterium]
MEKIFRNNRLIVIAFFTAFSVSSAPAANACSNETPIPVEMKFVGHIKNQLIFKLSFAGNAQHNEFTIIIKDKQNNTLYRENIKVEIFSKSFLLNTDEIGDDKLKFEIISKKSKERVVYEVNRKTHVSEEMTISKL